MSTTAVHREPATIITLDFRPPAPPPPAPQGLEQIPPANPPLQPTTQTQKPIAQGVSTADLRQIQEYATTKTSVLGFILKGIFSLGIHSLYSLYLYSHNRNLARQYLQNNGVNVGAVLSKMPWNASRSLAVLCTLMESGLPANTINELFLTKSAKDLQNAQFEIKHLTQSFTAAVIAKLAACNTPTFLKRVTDALVARGTENLAKSAARRPEGAVFSKASIEELTEFAKSPAILQTTDEIIINNNLDLFASLLAETDSRNQDLRNSCVTAILTLAQRPDVLNSNNPEVQSNLIDALDEVLQATKDSRQQQQAANAVLALAKKPTVLNSEDQFVNSTFLRALGQVVKITENYPQAQQATNAILAMTQRPNILNHDDNSITLINLLGALAQVIIVIEEDAPFEAAADKILELAGNPDLQRSENPYIQCAITDTLAKIVEWSEHDERRVKAIDFLIAQRDIPSDPAVQESLRAALKLVMDDDDVDFERANQASLAIAGLPEEPPAAPKT